MREFFLTLPGSAQPAPSDWNWAISSPGPQLADPPCSCGNLPDSLHNHDSIPSHNYIIIIMHIYIYICFLSHWFCFSEGLYHSNYNIVFKPRICFLKCSPQGLPCLVYAHLGSWVLYISQATQLPEEPSAAVERSGQLRCTFLLAFTLFGQGCRPAPL